MEWAKVMEGERKGQSVSALDVNPSINLIAEPMAPRNRSVSGYGAKIPTRYRARVFDNRFRRVYMVQWSNAGTAYIIYRGLKYAVTW